MRGSFALLVVVAAAGCRRDAPKPPPPPTSDWRWLAPLPQGNTLNAVHVDGRRVFAVGDAGTILRSDDGGATFTPLASGVTENLTGVTGDGGGLVIVGWGGTVLTSSEVSVAIGYNDPHYFSYLFKKNVGMNPRDYRNSCKR